jgi:hypothetical protein
MRILFASILFLSAMLLINCGGASPFKTTPQSSVGLTKTVANHAPLNNMFGINGYEWNFLQNPSDPNNGSAIYEPKMNLIKSFSAVRHYMDWGKIEPVKGQYTFNPVHDGSWNYDAIYLRLKQDSMVALADLKTCPQWLLNTYPANMRDPENVPAPYGLNRSEPASYLLQAKAAFQFAARYGSNKKLDRSLVTVNTTPRWTNDPANTVKIGLNYVHYIECDNERDKWWKGPQAKQTAEEYAANLSAFYDGNKGKLGKNAGVKNADPNMKIVMGGLASANVQYLKDMIAWCRKYRGLRPDGSVDLCFDVINYHYYASDGDVLKGKTGTKGVAPELSLAGSIADSFVAIASDLHKVPVWVTENGYDINPSSPQRTIAIGDKSVLLTQADWTIRSALLYMRHGVNRLFFYQLFDDKANGSVTYQTSGLLNDDLTKRPVTDYIIQVRKLMGNYTYRATINTDPLVDEYISGNKKIYALMIPDQKGRTGQYTLNIGNTKAVVYNLKPGNNTMVPSTIKAVKGHITLAVSETPVFVQLL